MHDILCSPKEDVKRRNLQDPRNLPFVELVELKGEGSGVVENA